MSNNIVTIKQHLASVPESLRVSLNACAQAVRVRYPELDSKTFFALLGVSDRSWKYWNDKGGARKWNERTESERANAIAIVEAVAKINIAANLTTETTSNETDIA